MALDLRRVQTKVAGLILTDVCTIWRDPEGTRDDTLGPDGLSYTDTPSTGDAVAVESDLACSVKWVNRYPHTGESGDPIVVSEYMVKFGMPFDNVQDSDRIEITEISHDERLIGKKLKVIEVVHGSLAVLRKVRCQLRERAVDIP
jgi:hypothetical protein